MEYKKQICELLDSFDVANQKIGVLQAVTFGWDVRDIAEYILNKKYPIEVEQGKKMLEGRLYIDQLINFAGKKILLTIKVNDCDIVVEQCCFMGVGNSIKFEKSADLGDYMRMLEFIGFNLINDNL